MVPCINVSVAEGCDWLPLSPQIFADMNEVHDFLQLILGRF